MVEASTEGEIDPCQYNGTDIQWVFVFVGVAYQSSGDF